MALEEYSFSHLLPTFLIPVGTQVVLKEDKVLADGVRPRGSVAVVAEARPMRCLPLLRGRPDGGCSQAGHSPQGIRGPAALTGGTKGVHRLSLPGGFALWAGDGGLRR